VSDVLALIDLDGTLVDRDRHRWRLGERHGHHLGQPWTTVFGCRVPARPDRVDTSASSRLLDAT
jgi:hypothetical protein